MHLPERNPFKCPREIIGLTFSENFTFENNEFQTARINEMKAYSNLRLECSFTIKITSHASLS